MADLPITLSAAQKEILALRAQVERMQRALDLAIRLGKELGMTSLQVEIVRERATAQGERRHG